MDNYNDVLLLIENIQYGLDALKNVAYRDDDTIKSVIEFINNNASKEIQELVIPEIYSRLIEDGRIETFISDEDEKDLYNIYSKMSRHGVNARDYEEEFKYLKDHLYEHPNMYLVNTLVKHIEEYLYD